MEVDEERERKQDATRQCQRVEPSRRPRKFKPRDSRLCHSSGVGGLDHQKLAFETEGM